MKRLRIMTRLLALPIFLAAAGAAAHHGVSRYDMDTVNRLDGRVTAWEWQSPHIWLHLTVRDAEGRETRWRIEGAPPRWMAAQGFTPESLNAGDRVAVTYHPAKGEPRAGILMHVTGENGERLSVNRPARLGGP